MAWSDYKICDLCNNAKVFYDANIEDERYRQTWGEPSDYDPIGMKVICGCCNKTHDVVIVQRALPDVQPAPVAVQTVLSNPLKDRGKMIKPFPGAPAGGYPLTPNPAESAQPAPVTVQTVLEEERDISDYYIESATKEEWAERAIRAENELKQALDIACELSVCVEYDYNGNVVGRDVAKAMLELDYLLVSK